MKILRELIMLLKNPILVTALFAWLTAQIMKILVMILLTKRFDIKMLITAGGMPSSHSAMVTSIATAIGKIEGWHSPVTALAVVLALIVMYDAAGVRRSAGRHAEIINIIISELFQQKRIIKEDKLKELIGHTPIEVLVGGLWGILIANIII